MPATIILVIRDILEKAKIDNRRSVTDSLLLRKVIMFLSNNIGNNTSASSISNTLLKVWYQRKKSRQCKPYKHI